MPHRTATSGFITLSRVDLQQLARGLWRWTALHPGWEPGEPESPADWPRDVGCIAYEADDALVFVDPLVPDGAWAKLDRLVERSDRVLVVRTVRWHRRSIEAVSTRYAATTSRARRALPDGVDAITIPGAGETMVWIPEHGALVPGDRLLGDGRGGLRMCPLSWLRYLPGRITPARLRRELRRALLDLPVRMVLVSHGDPVLRGAKRKLERALA
jgi:hypothetical protein